MQRRANVLFREDADLLAKENYFPISQTWAEGTWGCGAFVVALVLCIFLIGILVFIYLLIVKPAGTLTVTYELREAEKQCPRCAEKIRAAANVCRFCGYEFTLAGLASLR